jgi:hypothetical protein
MVSQGRRDMQQHSAFPAFGHESRDTSKLSTHANLQPLPIGKELKKTIETQTMHDAKCRDGAQCQN